MMTSMLSGNDMHRTCKAWSLSKQDTKTLQVLSLDVFELEWFTASFRQICDFQSFRLIRLCSKSENFHHSPPASDSWKDLVLHIVAYAKKSSDSNLSSGHVSARKPCADEQPRQGTWKHRIGKREITEITYQCKFRRTDVRIRWISKEGLRPVDGGIEKTGKIISSWLNTSQKPMHILSF